MAERAERGGEPFSFDCMAWLERVQAEIHEEIKDMTPEEELAYWNRPIKGPLGKWWRSIPKHSPAVRESPSERGEYKG